MPNLLRFAVLVMLLLARAATAAPAGSAGPMAHLFGYRVEPQAQGAFEAGYREHLQWHADHDDPLPWHGWYITDGARAGWFIDGTFDVAWDALDRRPAPVDDAADAARTFLPHVVPVLRESWQRKATGRAGPALRQRPPQLRVITYALHAGTGARFDQLVDAVLHHAGPARAEDWYAPTTGAALQRRVQFVGWQGGGDERIAPDLEQRIEATAEPATRERWLAEYAACVDSVQAETWRYLPELSRVPEHE